MKKTVITSVALSLCALTAAFCFAGCGNSGKSSSTASSSSAASATEAATTEASKKALVGVWESADAPGTFYTFYEDGTGVINGTGYSNEFSYTDDGSTIEITYSGVAAAQKSTYKVEGDTLTMTTDGATLTYKKSDGTPKVTESSAVAQPDSALLGTWENTENKDTGITFNADGTGSVNIQSVETKFTFEDKGSTVEVKIAGSDPQTSSYTIEDGKLTITAADGTVSHFTKK